MFKLVIAYIPEGGTPLSLARISDRTLLREAATAALLEAEQTTRSLMVADRTLGAIQAEETAKLRRVLSLLAITDENPIGMM